MKRYAWTILAILVLVLPALAACGPTPTPEKVIVRETVVSVQTAAPITVKETVVVKETAVPSAFDSADKAVEEAKKYAGITLNYVRESGLQAQDPLTMGPIWEQLTGIKVNVVEMSYLDMYTNQLQDHLTGGGSYDVLDVSPFWMIDYINAGVMEPLNDYIAKYMNPADLDDYLPPYKAEGVMSFDGTYYGLFDDGDVFVQYYRKDLFEDETNKAEFKTKYGYDLVPPTTAKVLFDAAEFFTKKYAPDLYGFASQRLEGQAYSWFIGPYAAYGGYLWDPATMKAQINGETGVKVLSELVQQNTVAPPGVVKWGFMEILSAFMDGKLAMIITWPPIGRWTAGYGDTAKQLSWVPPTKIAGKVGYMAQYGGRTNLAGNFNLAVSADSKHKEAAYLFAQWMTSPKISLQRVMLPFALRDPYRLTHYDSVMYRTAWPDAGAYLDDLKTSAMNGIYEPGIPGGREYMEALDKAITAAYAGTDVKAALDDCAKRWDGITNRLGLDSQKAAYNKWLKNPWAQPGPTVKY